MSRRVATGLAHAAGRTVVLGVDSLDLLLVQRWVATGRLPFFESLLRDSCLARLSVVSRVLQGALWPSLLTGRAPGHHGTFYLTQLTSGTYNLDPVAADHVTPEPYYKRLDEHGVRCAIVDVPNDIPQASFGGLQVVDWLTEFQFWRFATQPTADREQIEQRLGVLNRTGGYGPTQGTLEGHRRLRQRLEKSLEMKARLAKDLLARADLDHIFIVFAEPHKAGHFLWKYMDSAHPDHVAAEPYLRDAMLCLYQQLDRKLAELAALLTERDNLIVLSDHGMQANYRGDHLVGPILERLGLCGTGSAPSLERRAASTSAAVAQTPAAGWTGTLKSTAREAANRCAPGFVRQILRRKFGPAAHIDWSQVQAFQLPTDRNTYLRINLRGREPEGIVEPGEGYRELLSLVEKEFRALINVDTGKPAVAEVFRVHELYPGAQVEDLPDIAILWNCDAPINTVTSPRVGRVALRTVEDRSGNHREEGFLLARGPSIRRGPATLQGDILQVPSTLLALHGLQPPPQYELPPLEGLLAEKSRAPASRVA